MYTSGRSRDSLVWYAIHCPSGEKAPLSSVKGVVTNGVVFRSVSDIVQRSAPLEPKDGVDDNPCVYTRNLPSRETSVAWLEPSTFTTNSSWPPPLADLRYN